VGPAGGPGGAGSLGAGWRRIPALISRLKGAIFSARGTITSETNSTFRGNYAWTGREFDSATGLQYNRARYYDPKTGRWLSQDPLGFDAGDSNLYRYVLNDPLGGTDPSGKVVIQVHGVRDQGVDKAWKGVAEGLQAGGAQTVISYTWTAENFVSLKMDKQPSILLNGFNTIWYPRFDPVGDRGASLLKLFKAPAALPETLKILRTFGGGEALQAAIKLKEFVTQLRAELDKNPATEKEPIHIVAHSMGTMIALRALAEGAPMNNLVLLGSPLDAGNAAAELRLLDELLRMQKKERKGTIYNHYSLNDMVVGGVWNPMSVAGVMNPVLNPLPWISRVNPVGGGQAWQGKLPTNVQNVRSDVESHSAFVSETEAKNWYWKLVRPSKDANQAMVRVIVRSVMRDYKGMFTFTAMAGFGM
jgi:RHS repeat-associated protein